ncbi:MAG: hypothetical protein NC299_17555, partial [Lachnospiraceae bacterium]|nr:hypothetical protein [Lachnospiraceae bacterium]
AQISHEIEKKTTLDKKRGNVLEKRSERTVGDTAKANTTRGSPSAAQQKAAQFAKQRAHSGNAVTDPENADLPKLQERSLTNISPAEHFSTPTPTNSPLAKSGDVFSGKSRTVGKVDKKKLLSPEAMERRRKKFKNKRLKLAPRKQYKVLENGVVNTGEITKRKARTIYSQVPAKLQNAKPRKISRGQAELISFAMGGAAAGKKPHIPKAVAGAGKAVEIGKKPLSVIKGEFYKQADKSGDDGVKSVKLGMQISEGGTRAVKTAAKTGVKTVKQGSKITKRVYHKLHKPTSAEIRRKLRKRVNHNLVAEAKYLAKRAVKNGAKAAGKAAANAAKKAAQASFKVAQAAAKAVASAVAKVAALIAETMPWSLIVIGAIVLIVLIALMFGSLISSAGGSVAGGGAWLVDDNANQTPEDIYEGYKEFIEQAKDVMETQAKDALQSTVTGFCESDTSNPRKIIEYRDKNNSRLFYPASGADTTINALIEQFGTDDYADYMSLLFVLMTREKQQADGVTDAEIYDFDFKREDFEEFMKSVNENTCRFGDTFVIKTAVETSPHACPYNCRRETRSGCRCCSSTDPETGEITHYCGGHCPVDHTKMTVTLYTVKDYYGRDYPEIYNFTDNEKTRYEASKAIIQGLLEYWEDNE